MNIVDYPSQEEIRPTPLNEKVIVFAGYDHVKTVVDRLLQNGDYAIEQIDTEIRDLQNVIYKI